MYAQPWVQAMVAQIQDFLASNAEWLGFDDGREQRVLDYACGHGTISTAVLKANPKAICRGIDLDAGQVQRYNDNAAAHGQKMHAVEGDLYAPNDALAGPEWHGFDVAVISMALHHVRDPVQMLRLLRQRLRPDGRIIVVEFLGKEGGPEKGEMVEVVGNQRIWPGFTTGGLEGKLGEAGFGGCEVKVLQEPARVPRSVQGRMPMGSGEGGEEMWCFFARADVVA